MTTISRLLKNIFDYMSRSEIQDGMGKKYGQKLFVNVNGKAVMYQEYKCNETAHDKLKSKLIDMREMPRTMLIREIGARNCIHDGEFCLSDQECWGCDLSNECLEIISGFEKLSTNRHMGVILRKTFVARDYILKKIGGEQHSQIDCSCMSCNWLRELDVVLMSENLAS